MNVVELKRLVASLRRSAFVHYDEGEYECDYGLAADMLEELARRVIAAEKLVEALLPVIEDLCQSDMPTFKEIDILYDALTAYKATK